ncbi:hypothetical protein ACFX1S_023317 [Malus domestica]
MQNVPYAQAVGSLMYAMTSTRPDICHAVGLISQATWMTESQQVVTLSCLEERLFLGIPKEHVNVFCDNKSAIFLIKSGANSSKGKHIDVKYHYVQDIVEKGEVEVDYIPSEEMVADPMTKGLSLEKFREHVTTMGLQNI